MNKISNRDIAVFVVTALVIGFSLGMLVLSPPVLAQVERASTPTVAKAATATVTPTVTPIATYSPCWPFASLTPPPPPPTDTPEGTPAPPTATATEYVYP